jgi:hypothetical protein
LKNTPASPVDSAPDYSAEVEIEPDLVVIGEDVVLEDDLHIEDASDENVRNINK